MILVGNLGLRWHHGSAKEQFLDGPCVPLSSPIQFGVYTFSQVRCVEPVHWASIWQGPGQTGRALVRMRRDAEDGRRDAVKRGERQVRGLHELLDRAVGHGRRCVQGRVSARRPCGARAGGRTDEPRVHRADADAARLAGGAQRGHEPQDRVLGRRVLRDRGDALERRCGVGSGRSAVHGQGAYPLRRGRRWP